MSTDRNPLETYLKAELQRRIDDMLSYGEEMDSASWGYEEGVLLTGNEAIAILAELSRKDAEIEALREAAKDVVSRWDSPKWKYDEHTGVIINRLRVAAKLDQP